MHPKKIVEDVMLSDEYKRFAAGNKGYRLTTVFNVGEGWACGFYSKGEDRMVTFTASPVIMSKPQEVFHKEEVQALDMTQVILDVEQCDERVMLLHQTKYSLHTISKKIVVLHQHDVPEYNVTLITLTFSVINIKINATTGELIKDTIESALAFKARDGAEFKSEN